MIKVPHTDANENTSSSANAELAAPNGGVAGAPSIHQAGDQPFRFGLLQGTPLNAMDYAMFALIFLIGLVARAVYLGMIADSPLFASPILDAEAHDMWARAIVAGETVFPGAYFKAPLYPGLLAVIYRLTDGSYMAPRIFQIVLGSLSCGFIYLLGREVFGRAVGVIAGLATTIYWTLIFYDCELLLESLSIFLTLVSVWLVFRAAAKNALWLWIVAGLVMGLSAINRPNVLPYIPFLALWIIWSGRSRIGRSVVQSIAWCVACVLPILPVTIRNAVVGGDFVLIASQGGPNFYIGNNPASDGYTASLPGARNSWVGGVSDLTSMAEQEIGRKLKASEVDRFFYDKGWEFIRSEPKQALKLTALKTLLFFSSWEIPNDSDPTSLVDLYAPLFRLSPVTSGSILALGLVGFVLALFDFKRTLPLTGFVAIYAATVIAFFVCARFRIPLMPFALVLAASVPVRAWAAVRRADWRTVVLLAICTYLVWKLVISPPTETILKRHEAVTHQRIGAKLAALGKPGAAEEFQAALRINPDCVEAEASLAYFELERRDLDESIRHFYRVIELSPSMDVYSTFASALAQRGRWDETIRILRLGLDHLGGYLDLKRSLAFILATCPVDQLRNGHEAVLLAESVIAVGGDLPQNYDTLACALAEAGRFDDAVRAESKALELARQYGMPEAAAETGARLELFKARKPYRQTVGLKPSNSSALPGSFVP